MAHAEQIALALFADVGHQQQPAARIPAAWPTPSRRARSASRAASPAPLSETPGPRNRPSASTEISSLLRGASTVSRCAVSATYGGSPNAASTLPARSMEASHPEDAELLQKPRGALLLQKGGRRHAAKLQVDLVDPLLLAREKLQAFADARWSASSLRLIPVEAVLAAMLPASVAAGDPAGPAITAAQASSNSSRSPDRRGLGRRGNSQAS